MRKARFKETEIVRVLKQVEGGRQVKEVCRFGPHQQGDIKGSYDTLSLCMLTLDINRIAPRIYVSARAFQDFRDHASDQRG